MAFDTSLATTRDRLRSVLGDIGSVSGFPGLSVDGSALIPELTETLYDSYIAKFGAQEAGAKVCTLVITRLSTSWKDGDTSENADNIIEEYRQLRDDLRGSKILVEGLDADGVTVAAKARIEAPDLTVFRTL